MSVRSYFLILTCLLLAISCSSKVSSDSKPTTITQEVPAKDTQRDVRIGEIAASKGVEAIKKDDFMVISSDEEMRIAIFGKVDDVIGKLGQPDEGLLVYEDKDRPGHSLMRDSWYGLKIEYIKSYREVNSISINEANYKTYRGLKVGDEEDLVLSKYGKEYAGDGVTKMSYGFSFEGMETAYAIIFSIKDKKVVLIEMKGVD